MARVQLIVEHDKEIIEVARVPFRGDFIAKDGGLEVMAVVLVGPSAPVDAVVHAVAAQQKLSMDMQNAVLEFQEEKASG